MKNNELNKLEQKDKFLLTLEWVLIGIALSTFLLIIFILEYIELSIEYKILITILNILILVIGLIFAIKIEQIAGYYECKKCNHKYIPKYNQVFWAMHIVRTRYMKCPKCNNYSWNKKVLKK